MKQYLQSHNSTLQDTYYYGDSIDDLPVLQTVGHPVCVSPDSRLKKTAVERGWEIQRI
ncbi:MAG: hypothetical protein IPH88_06780 [Bacteroidales bacterium]|nr:hypothetical protein [Bacteroidales bacterium]